MFQFPLTGYILFLYAHTSHTTAHTTAIFHFLLPYSFYTLLQQLRFTQDLSYLLGRCLFLACEHLLLYIHSNLLCRFQSSDTAPPVLSAASYELLSLSPMHFAHASSTFFDTVSWSFNTPEPFHFTSLYSRPTLHLICIINQMIFFF